MGFDNRGSKLRSRLEGLGFKVSGFGYGNSGLKLWNSRYFVYGREDKFWRSRLGFRALLLQAEGFGFINEEVRAVGFRSANEFEVLCGQGAGKLSDSGLD